MYKLPPIPSYVGRVAFAMIISICGVMHLHIPMFRLQQIKILAFRNTPLLPRGWFYTGHYYLRNGGLHDGGDFCSLQLAEDRQEIYLCHKNPRIFIFTEILHRVGEAKY